MAQLKVLKWSKVPAQKGPQEEAWKWATSPCSSLTKKQLETPTREPSLWFWFLPQQRTIWSNSLSYPQGKPESTILKESKFIQKDLQAPTLDFLMLPTSRTYWYDHVQVSNPRTPSFLDSPPNTSTLACVFFKLQWQQLNWSSRRR